MANHSFFFFFNGYTAWSFFFCCRVISIVSIVLHIVCTQLLIGMKNVVHTVNNIVNNAVHFMITTSMELELLAKLDNPINNTGHCCSSLRLMNVLVQQL